MGKRRITWRGYLVGWTLSFNLAILIVYGKLPMENNVDKYLNSAADTMYLMFDRYTWSCCILFVCFACQTGGAGFIGSFLEWDFWVIISKLSYSMYLLHPILMKIAYGSTFVVPWHLTFLEGLLMFFGYLVLAFTVSLLFYLGIEAPLMNLEKNLMG